MSDLDGNNAIRRRYVYGQGSDEPVIWFEGADASDKRILFADERGSVVRVKRSDGSTLAINTYDEYGIPGANNVGRFGYTGQTWLPELGMWNYKARLYSPTLGRFLQTDPIGYGDGLNWYNYVGSDPINQTDPSGLAMPELDCVKHPNLCPRVNPPLPSGDNNCATYTYVEGSQLALSFSDAHPCAGGSGGFTGGSPSGAGAGPGGEAIGGTSSQNDPPGTIYVTARPIPRGSSRGLEPSDLGLNVNIVTLAGSIGAYDDVLEIYVAFLEGSGSVTRQGLKQAIATAKSMNLKYVSISAIIANQKLEGLMLPSSPIFRQYPGTQLIIKGPTTTVVIPVQ